MPIISLYGIVQDFTSFEQSTQIQKVTAWTSFNLKKIRGGKSKI